MHSELLKIKPQEWEDAKAFFKKNPQEIKFRKAKKLAYTHSFFYIDNTLYAVNNTKHHYPEPDAGAGGFSRVKFAIDQNNNRFAIKAEYPDPCKNLSKIDSIMKEFGQMVSDRKERKTNAGETGTIRLSLTCEIPVETKIYTVLKYLGDRDLFSELKEHPEEKGISLSEDETLVLMLKAMMSVQKLHQKNIIHTDLKLENFVVDGQGEHRVVTVIDFDFSVKLLPEQYSAYKKYLTGTRAYLAPETIKSKEYSFKSDVYAFGYLLCGLNVNEKFYKELLFRLPENRPHLIQAMYNIVSHLERKINEPSNTLLKAEMYSIISDFYKLSRDCGYHFLPKASETYLPRQLTPLNIHIPHEQKSQKHEPASASDSSLELLNEQLSNLEIATPSSECCIPCRLL